VSDMSEAFGNEPTMAARRPREQCLAELFQAVGAVVVAGGHVEWYLQRLLLWLRGQGPADLPTVTRLTWTDLVQAIHVEAPRSAKADEIAALMQEANEPTLKVIRDNVVHAYWWTTGGPGIHGNRHQRDGKGSVIAGNMDVVRKGADDLFAFSERLAHLIPDDGWPTARMIDD
jgi:hypothetical protein